MLTKLCSFYTILDFYNLLCSGYAWILPSFHDVFYKIFCLDWLASTNNELSVGRGIEKWSGGQLIKRIIWLLKTREDASHLSSFLQYWSIYALILFVLLLCCYPASTYAAPQQHQGRLFWIICKRLKVRGKAGRLQLIQNSAPSVALGRQCCIRIVVHWWNMGPSI